MKHLSASIIVLAGALILVGACRFTSDTQTFVEVVGLVVCLIGLGGWFVGLREK